MMKKFSYERGKALYSAGVITDSFKMAGVTLEKFPIVAALKGKMFHPKVIIKGGFL